MCLEEIITDPVFKDLVKGLLGTHSFRKGPATYTSRCGVARDIVNGRGRWKGTRSKWMYTLIYGFLTLML